MTVSPLPTHGRVLAGRDIAGRTLRVSAHPETGRVVLSIWQDDTCRATVRLAAQDVPGLLEALGDTLLPEASERLTGLSTDRTA
jgi:hypothetical protein